MQCIGEPHLTIAPSELWLYVNNQFGPQPLVIWGVYRIAKGGLRTHAVLPLCDVHALQVRLFEAAADGLQWQGSGFGLVHPAPLCVLKFSGRMFQFQGHGPTQLVSLGLDTTGHMLYLSVAAAAYCPQMEAAGKRAQREAGARGTAST